MTDAELAKLKKEITDDQLELGYAGKSDPEIADILNAINKDYKIDREAIDGQELQMAVMASEYYTLTDKQRDFWQTLLSAGSGVIVISDTRVKDQIAAIWGALTTTLVNLVALQTRAASRAEMTVGHSVGMFDVAEARRHNGE